MKKIFHLGSSWSESNSMVNHGLPFFIASKLESKGIDFTYYSTALGGCGLGTQFEILTNILNEHLDPDLIILEVTTSDRFHAQIKHPSKIVWDKDDGHDKVLVCRDWLIEHYIFWMPMYKEIINRHWQFLYNKDTYLKTAKALNNVNFNWDSLFLSRICAIKSILQKRNIPYIIYAHDSNQLFEDQNSKFAHREIIEQLDFTVNGILGDNFTKFSIDSGHHMSPKGDKLIAEHILVPRILEKLK